AGREGWEESRGILGDLSKIREQVCNSSSIGKTHQMFFTKLTHSENVTNQAFQNLTFSDSCRMEKKEIAWVEAEKIFQAVRNKTNQFSEDGKVYRLRGCFAKSISEALSHPEYRQVIAKLSNKINAKVQCNNIASDCVLGICSEPTWAQSPVPFTKGNNNEWLGEVAPGKEFKFVILNRQNLVKWENGSNRQIYTPMGLAYSHPNFA